MQRVKAGFPIGGVPLKRVREKSGGKVVYEVTDKTNSCTIKPNFRHYFLSEGKLLGFLAQPSWNVWYACNTGTTDQSSQMRQQKNPKALWIHQAHENSQAQLCNRTFDCPASPSPVSNIIEDQGGPCLLVEGKQELSWFQKQETEVAAGKRNKTGQFQETTKYSSPPQKRPESQTWNPPEKKFLSCNQQHPYKRNTTGETLP